MRRLQEDECVAFVDARTHVFVSQDPFEPAIEVRRQGLATLIRDDHVALPDGTTFFIDRNGRLVADGFVQRLYAWRPDVRDEFVLESVSDWPEDREVLILTPPGLRFTDGSTRYAPTSRLPVRKFVPSFVGPPLEAPSRPADHPVFADVW